jgi:hypothetical protein
MKWFKHISDSLDDPFIFELMEEFGADGYLVFFGTLEIYSREFSPNVDWKLSITWSYLRQKLRISQPKLQKILSKIDKWEIEFIDNKVVIFIPKFTELLDEWSRRKLGSHSGVTPKILIGNIDKDKDTDKELDKEKEIKKKKPKTSIPENFTISDRVKKWAIEKKHQNLEDHLESFKLKCRAKDYQYVDWDEAFMNAVRDNWAKISNGVSQTPTSLPTSVISCPSCGRRVTRCDLTETGCVKCMMGKQNE